MIVHPPILVYNCPLICAQRFMCISPLTPDATLGHTIDLTCHTLRAHPHSFTASPFNLSHTFFHVYRTQSAAESRQAASVVLLSQRPFQIIHTCVTTPTSSPLP